MSIAIHTDDNISSFNLKGEKECVLKIEQICNEINSSWKLSPKNLFTLNLILEELISNIIFYGFDNDQDKFINVELRKDKNTIFLKVIDNAKPFNINDVNSKPQETDLDKMKIGGLGIHLVKNMSKKIEYENHNGRNIILVEIDADD